MEMVTWNQVSHAAIIFSLLMFQLGIHKKPIVVLNGMLHLPRLVQCLD
jgi:hypothetical protein